MSVCVKRKIEEDIKIIIQYVEAIWLYKIMRRTKYYLRILKSNFRGELCEEEGENKNSSDVNRPEIGVYLRLN